MDRLTVPAAAARLGVSENALRKRIQRDTIQWEHGDDGRVYVYLSPNEPPTMTDHAGDHATDQVADLSLMQAHLDALQTQIEHLKSIIETRDEELRRKDHLLAAALERIPELEPATEAPDARQTPGEGPDGVGGPAPNAEEPERRPSWWRRVFGA